MAAIVATLFTTIPETLLSIFSNDPTVHQLGRPLLAIAAVFQLIDAMGMISGGSLRGAGDTKWPFIVSASLAWLLRLPLVYTLAVTFEGGVYGAWIGELAFVTALSACNFFRFRSGAWRSIRI
jgi:Na+-driven multidrug efflux pump